MNTYATVVLAAGKGTRMRSTLPKMLHPLAGLPLLVHVLKSVEAIPSTAAFAPLRDTMSSYRPRVVLGHESEQVAAAFGDRCLYAIQPEQVVTGHAVLMAQSVVDALDPLPQTVLVCYGDTHLVGRDVLRSVEADDIKIRAVPT